MKNLGKIGMVLGVLVFAFALYVHFVVVPSSEIAASKLDTMQTLSMENGTPAFEQPGYAEVMAESEKKVDMGGYVFFGSMLPLLLCLIASVKKDKMGMVGLLLSLGAFFIGAGYGTHMFS